MILFNHVINNQPSTGIIAFHGSFGSHILHTTYVCFICGTAKHTIVDKNLIKLIQNDFDNRSNWLSYNEFAMRPGNVQNTYNM